MRWAHFLILVLASTYAKEEDNEVNPLRKSAVNLDANLRRALLKALTELENEANEKKSLPHLDTGEKFIEKASASALSIFASTDPSPTTEPVLTTTEEATEKQIVVIQKSHGLQHKPLTSLEKHEHEQILTSASNSFSSASNKLSQTNQNSVSNELKATTKAQVKVATTAAPTTTTEESQAKVEDVQFFSAPLVAAFTVHQDERGLPKSVEPIYRNAQKTEKQIKEPITTQQPLRQQPQEPFRQQPQEPFRQQQQEQFRTQLALQDKQRSLEAEILQLKQQQHQQNYLIRQQQIYHEQQLQLQKQKILEEQNRLHQNRQTRPPFLPTVNTNFQATTQRTDFTTDSSRGRGNLISFQPSISFTSHQHPSGVLPLNAQQLPVKTAGDFRSPFAATSNYQEFNYLSHQQPPLRDTFASFNFVPTVQPQLTLTAPKHNRVFRQESNTGNYVSFNNYNQFNQPQQHQNDNRFFRSNVETVKSVPFSANHQVQPPVVNQQLNHLLYNSGLIRGKQHEDLNIVSKVLALNHYGGDYRFSSSSVNEKRVPAPVIKKV